MKENNFLIDTENIALYNLLSSFLKIILNICRDQNMGKNKRTKYFLYHVPTNSKMKLLQLWTNSFEKVTSLQITNKAEVDENPF